MNEDNTMKMKKDEQAAIPERLIVSGDLNGNRVNISFAPQTKEELLFRVKNQLANSYMSNKDNTFSETR